MRRVKDHGFKSLLAVIMLLPELTAAASDDHTYTWAVVPQFTA